MPTVNRKKIAISKRNHPFPRLARVTIQSDFFSLNFRCSFETRTARKPEIRDHAHYPYRLFRTFGVNTNCV